MTAKSTHLEVPIRLIKHPSTTEITIPIVTSPAAQRNSSGLLLANLASRHGCPFDFKRWQIIQICDILSLSIFTIVHSYISKPKALIIKYLKI